MKTKQAGEILLAELILIFCKMCCSLDKNITMHNYVLCKISAGIYSLKSKIQNHVIKIQLLVTQIITTSFMISVQLAL